MFDTAKRTDIHNMRERVRRAEHTRAQCWRAHGGWCGATVAEGPLVYRSCFVAVESDSQRRKLEDGGSVHAGASELICGSVSSM
jgi:hypothetical protein